MRTRRFKQVDVFGDTPFGGNPVAVIIDAGGLEADDMRRIARWTNLSETTFLFPPSAGGAYAVRIFTPGGELPFAGHPTIGTAHAAIEAGLVPSGASALVQECGVGPVNLTIRARPDMPPVISFELPRATPRTLPPDDLSELSGLTGMELTPEAALPVDVGPVWVVIDMGDADRVHGFQPDFGGIERWTRRLDVTGITMFGRGTGEHPIYVRSFAPAVGVPEDPVCGSGNGAVAAYLLTTGRAERIGSSYEAGQGFEVGRTGRIFVSLDSAASRVHIGGVARTLIDGTISA
jgi:PhzF family phenazine biosynthesis protein